MRSQLQMFPSTLVASFVSIEQSILLVLLTKPLMLSLYIMVNLFLIVIYINKFFTLQEIMIF
jgi:hypothetical protein